MRRHLFLPCLVLLLVGCEPSETTPPPADAVPEVEMPTLATKADTMAMHAYEAAGGPAAWAALPYLRFEFAGERDGEARPGIKHLWNRRTGDYRLEMPGGEDSTYVVLFNVNTREGQAYLNGTALDSTQNAQRLEQAYGRFINDTYWLLMPFKLFDPGVTRTYVPDSSNAERDVIHLSFAEVGLTPGDEYWVFMDKETGRVEEWAYHLQSDRDGRFTWTGYETHDTPAGPLHFATRKEAAGGNAALLTYQIDTPTDPPADLFTDPNPRL